MDEAEWFRKLGKEVTITLPASVSSQLSEEVKENLQQFQEGERYLVLKDGGRSVHQDLIKSNFSSKATCERANCLVCCATPSNGS